MAFLKTLFGGQAEAASLRDRTLRSGAWLGAGFAVQKALQLGSNLILTRLLFPEAFGLMALATVFIVGVHMFSDIGLKPAVIRDPRGDEPVFLNTAWTIQVVRGFLLAIIGAAIAYPVSLVYGEPILFPLLAVISMISAITGFSSIGLITAERRLDFKTLTILALIGQVTSIGLLVLIAYMWRSVWALALANVISATITVIIGHAILPRHRHRLELDSGSAKSLVNFGRWILFSTLATYLGGEGLKAIQGGFLTPAEFGILAIAYTISGIPNDLGQKLSTSLGLPVISEAYRNAPDDLARVLHKLRQRTVGISLFLFGCVILTAEPAVEFLYDVRYHAASEYLIALSIANAIAAISAGYTGAILVIGRGSIYFMLMITLTVLRIVMVVIGYEMFGTMGMLYSLSISNAVFGFFVAVVSRRLKFLDLKLDFIALAVIMILVLLETNLTFFLNLTK